MNAPPYTMTAESITVVWEGKSHTVQKGSPQFNALRHAITHEKWDDISKNLTVTSTLEQWSKGKFTISANQSYFEGKAIPSSINERIIKMATGGEDPKPLFLFWERLKKNPSFRSVQQLWPFLAQKGIPLTKEGRFLAYKSVRQDYMDHHSGKFENKPGAVLQMPRNEISDDPQVACHEGFHVGALAYAQSFRESSRMLVCEVDPEDVVCVPWDSSQQKMRVCKYKVLGLHNGQLLPSTTFEEDVHTETAKKVMGVADQILAGVEEASDLKCGGCEHPKTEHWHDDEEDTSCGLVNCECGEFEPDNEEEAKNIDALAKKVAEDKKKPSLTDARGSDKLAETPDKVVVKGKVVKDRENAIPKEKPKKEVSAADSKITPQKMNAMDKMDMDQLLLESLDTVRQYATYRVKLIGASKIPGGKTALIMKILEVRTV